MNLDKSELLAEASDRATTDERLSELAGHDDPEVAVRALGRLMKGATAEFAPVIAAANDQSSVVAVAFALLAEGLRHIPGRVALMAPERITAALAWAGFEDEGRLVPTLLNAILASRGPLVEETARGMASDWDLSLIELLDGAEASVKKHPSAPES